MKSLGLYILGQYVQTQKHFKVNQPFLDPHDLQKLGSLELATVSDKEDLGLLDVALQGGAESFYQIIDGFFPLSERVTFLKKFRDKYEDQSPNLAHVMSREVGKPKSLAELEVKRGLATIEDSLAKIETFFQEETFAGAGLARNKVVRMPRGPLLAITPFNFPINLVLHKIIPALMTGNPVILKPSPKAMLTALSLVDLLHSSELPAGLISLVQCDNDLVAPLIEDTRVAQVSFTGSAPVGWHLRSFSRKNFFLELGGAAPVYVDESASVEEAARAIVNGALNYSGQVCISIQNIFYHSGVGPSFKRALKAACEEYRWGHLLDEQSLSSTVIDEAAQARLKQLESKLLAAGARVFAQSEPQSSLRPDCQGYFVTPRFFEGVPQDSLFVQEEYFGPYANLFEIPSFEAWLKSVNQTKYRLQAGIFTQNPLQIKRAQEGLLFGGVVINGSPSTRIDALPYGGCGESGIGREGPLYAMRDYTDLKTIL